jgi:hypothetical protein
MTPMKLRFYLSGTIRKMQKSTWNQQLYKKTLQEAGMKKLKVTYLDEIEKTT